MIQRPRATTPRTLFTLATALAATAVVGCSSPAAPTQDPVVLAPLQLLNAQVFFGGRSVNGQTIQQGQMQGNSTLFQAKLTAGNSPALGRTVQVQYQRPGGGSGGMMGGAAPGTFHLYDDGTHGDPIAGDGIYCFEDTDGLYGLHHHNALHGQYHYEFFGINHDDHHSNHMQVTVTLAPDSGATASIQLSNAQVVVGGQVVNGWTMSPGQMPGNSTLFRATLTDPNGPALGHTVQVQYQIPHGPGMGGGPGSGPGTGPGFGYMWLYDDGTHGDPVPGDGIYCYLDTTGQYGFHHHNAAHGQYHYEFFGIDHDDHHTNHMQVWVSIGS